MSTDTSVALYGGYGFEPIGHDEDAEADAALLGSGTTVPALIVNQKIKALADALPNHLNQLILGGKQPMPVQHEDGCAKVFVLNARWIMQRKYSIDHPDQDKAGRTACIGFQQKQPDGSRKFQGVTNGGVVTPHFIVDGKTNSIQLPDDDLPATDDCTRCGYGLGRCGGDPNGRGFASPTKIKLIKRGKPFAPTQTEAKSLVTKPSQDDCQATIRAYVLVLLPNGALVAAQINFRGSNFNSGKQLLEAWSQDNRIKGANGAVFMRNLRVKSGANTTWEYSVIEYAGTCRDESGKPYLMTPTEYSGVALPLMQRIQEDPKHFYGSLGSDGDGETTESSAAQGSTGAPASFDVDDAY